VAMLLLVFVFMLMIAHFENLSAIRSA